MYLHAYGKSGLEIPTNALAFASEIFPFAINIFGGVTNFRVRYIMLVNLTIMLF